MSKQYSFEQITQHLQNTGFVFQGSSIYGGLSNTWDYGPLGAEMKRNIRSRTGSAKTTAVLRQSIWRTTLFQLSFRQFTNAAMPGTSIISIPNMMA